MSDRRRESDPSLMLAFVMLWTGAIMFAFVLGFLVAWWWQG